MYYSRMRAITQLLPLLLKSPLPARVVSVFAAGTEAKLYADDLSLRDLKKYSYLQARQVHSFSPPTSKVSIRPIVIHAQSHSSLSSQSPDAILENAQLVST
jgi:hypothetical protein